MRERRTSVPDGTFFFTVHLADPSLSLLTDHIDILRDAVRRVRTAHPFEILAMVVLPDHLHALWRLPEDDNEHALRWKLIQSEFCRRTPHLEPIRLSRRLQRERSVWRSSYRLRPIRNDEELRQHTALIHANPVRHGHVQRPEEWPYSTVHRTRTVSKP